MPPIRCSFSIPKAFDVPLISFEGSGLDGIDKTKGLRKKAASAGVKVLTPAEFYDDANSVRLAAEFYTSFLRGQAEYSKSFVSEKAILVVEIFEAVDAYYRHVLFGETNGFDAPLPVKL